MRPIVSARRCAPLIPIAVLAAWALCVAAPAQGAAKLLGANLEASAAGATLRLRLSGSIEQRLFTLTKPDRIVLDLPATQAAAGWSHPQPAGVVRAVRSATKPDGTLRVVLELDRPLTAVASVAPTIKGGARELVVRVGDGVTAPQAVPSPRAPVPVAHAPRDSNRDIVIAIDAGHGGEDPGASGRGGTREKDVTLAIARTLAARIDARPGLRAVLTRDADRFVPLRERTARATNVRADMFISIHADAVRDRDVTGASVYVLSERGASSEAARWLAERENAADLKGGIPLADVQENLRSVLLDLSQSASIGVSAEAADRILDALNDVGAIRKREVQRAGFVVLKSREMPAMLVETAYISNPDEERKLRSPKYQKQIAAAIEAGVVAYFSQHPPEGTRYARQRRDGGGSINLASSAP